MEYVSTRNKDIRLSSARAIVRGISEDGGLFLPEYIPELTDSELKSVLSMDYRAAARFVLSRFLTDFTDYEIESCVGGAYTGQKFGGDNPAPVKKLDDDKYMLELWHGPTCAFKDMALQILPRLLTVAVKKEKADKTVVILVATSGDTGKAALEGFCDVEGAKIVVFYPSEGVSEVQKMQMVTQGGSNTCVFGLVGNFDDCQSGVKQILGDSDVIKKLARGGYVFSSANSINWGRLVPQVVYYFTAYGALAKNGEINIGDAVDFVVPTGNFGDILAGYIAKRMGLPVGKLVCASNTNKVLTDFIETGVYNKNRDFYTTTSPSMDILISSNLERLMFMMTDGNAPLVSKYMAQLSQDGAYKVESSLLENIKSVFSAGFADERETAKAIGEAYSKYGYVIDPHTAVAYSVAAKCKTDAKQIILSTASPYKFPKSVLCGIGENADASTEFELLCRLESKTGMPVPPSLACLAKRPVRFADVCKKQQMTERIYGFLGL